MKKLQVLYITAFFAACLVPSLGMAVTKQEASSENRTLAKFPSAKTEEGSINVDWMEEFGDYFQDHFAFRNELVTANAVLNGKVLGTSTADGVIQGTNDWLYYKDSLNDYLGEELLGERSLYNIAHSLSLMQEYLEGKDVDFVFTVAPNKNSLYGENMPYYDSLKVSEDKNLVNLETYLNEEGVSYVNLYETFLNEDEVLYHERDSHWNNKGAALAADTLLTALEKDHDSYEGETYTVRTDFEGDLDEMLYPLAMTKEDEIYYDKGTTFAYVEEVESNFEPRITTVNPSREGSVVVFRDSFGNALLPFLADAYANAYFSRGIPYQMTEIDTHTADTVIVERAERFLPDMAQDAPQMAGLIRMPQVSEESVSDGVLDAGAEVQGSYVKITGRIQEDCLEADDEIYVRVNNGTVYEAFPVDVELEDGTMDSNGFCLYVYSSLVTEDGNTYEIMKGKEGTAQVIGVFEQ